MFSGHPFKTASDSLRHGVTTAMLEIKHQWKATMTLPRIYVAPCGHPAQGVQADSPYFAPLSLTKFRLCRPKHQATQSQNSWSSDDTKKTSLLQRAWGCDARVLLSSLSLALCHWHRDMAKVQKRFSRVNETSRQSHSRPSRTTSEHKRPRALLEVTETHRHLQE